MVHFSQAGGGPGIKLLGAHAVDLVVAGTFGAHVGSALLYAGHHYAGVALGAQRGAHGGVQRGQLLLFLFRLELWVLANFQPCHGVGIVRIFKAKHAFCFFRAEILVAQRLLRQHALAHGACRITGQARPGIQIDQCALEGDVQIQQAPRLFGLRRIQPLVQLGLYLQGDGGQVLFAQGAQVVIKQAAQLAVGQRAAAATLGQGFDGPQIAIGRRALLRRHKSHCIGRRAWRQLHRSTVRGICGQPQPAAPHQGTQHQHCAAPVQCRPRQQA